MDFKAKLNHLFKSLDISNAEVARLGDIDPSLISRFRTGSRIPSRGSRQVLGLCRGIVLLAQEKKKAEALSACCNLPLTQDPKALCKTLESWLDDEDSALKKRRCVEKHKKNSTKHKRQPIRAFSDKLDALMNTFDVSNIRLAKALHIDASLISRFRTGMRVPVIGSWLPQELCRWFAARIATHPSDNAKQQLAALTGKPLPQDLESLEQQLLDWLQEQPDNSILMNSFLERLDTFQPAHNLPIHLLQPLLAVEAPRKPTHIFYGAEGLQNAVKSFLALAAREEQPSTLYLYSDQPMSWLTNDPEFTKTWTMLMGLVLHRGNRIRIIHNVDRSLGEMFDAIAKWLPLYITGQIEPYYSKYSGDSRFYQTKFIVPERYCINAAFVAGTEDSAEYLFCSEKNRVQYHFNQFKALLENSLPLSKIFPLQKPEDYSRAVREMNSKDGEEKHLLPTLSLGTMPETLLHSILGRTDLADQDKEKILSFRRERAQSFEKALHSEGIAEIVAMPADENLFGQGIKLDIPSVIFDEPLFYKASEYAAHIDNIRILLEKYKSYRFCPLPISPFENVQLSVKEEEMALAIKSDVPSTAFLFNHPLMCQAFSSYLNSLKWKTSIDKYDRNIVISHLLKYTT